jgi:uncharacterized protein YigE (DUF2233 family)
VVCRADLRRHRISLHWQAPDGTAFGSLAALQRHLVREGTPALFAVNAGMYHADLDPVGLYVENGRQRVRASTASGPGNFHLKPNGVFFVADGRAGVMETTQFLRRGPRVELATQSGPMLVINGRMHPRFNPASDSRKIRNGVGVADGTVAYFVLSEQPVTFSAFASVFRDVLRTPNALYLDGSVSSLLSPDYDRQSFRSLGPLLAVSPRAGPTP